LAINFGHASQLCYGYHNVRSRTCISKVHAWPLQPSSARSQIYHFSKALQTCYICNNLLYFVRGLPSRRDRSNRTNDCKIGKSYDCILSFSLFIAYIWDTISCLQWSIRDLNFQRCSFPPTSTRIHSLQAYATPYHKENKRTLHNRI
jgi:hypothetical protein